MPKFYRQNKKRIDPRFFMNEKLERTLKESPDWPEDKTQGAMMGRARNLAQQGMESQVSGEVPPWEEESAASGDGTPDVKLDLLNQEDIQFLRNDILRHFELSKYSGGGNRAEKFKEVMGKLGIDLGPSEP